jgi:hypothetical protein
MQKKSFLKYLDLSLQSGSELSQLHSIIDKIGKVCSAVDKKMNLGDLLRYPQNLSSLQETFGTRNYPLGIQILTKLALEDYTYCSFKVNISISGRNKIDNIYRFTSKWDSFDSVLSIQHPDNSGIILLNLKNLEHFNEIEEIRESSLLTIYIKTKFGERNLSNEEEQATALKNHIKALQYTSEEEIEAREKVVSMENFKKRNGQKKASKTPSFNNIMKNRLSMASQDQDPVSNLKVIVNKIDTVVHAGNAHLILEQVRSYSGVTEMFVLRDKKEKVLLNTDSIWAKDIRNGETILFEFYGEEPSQEFLKELAKSVNEYTQMDNVMNG